MFSLQLWEFFSLIFLFVSSWLYFFLKSGTVSYLEIPNAVEALTLICLSIFFFYEQLRKPDTAFLYTVPRFWLVSGYLIYIAGTFFLFLYMDYLSLDEQKKYFIHLNSFFLILKSIMLSIGMLMKTKVTERTKFQLT